jgi:hypothetical protein
LILLKILLPSWSFFADFDKYPRLYYRFGETTSDLGLWAPVFTHSRRPLWSLFFNPEDNFQLYCNSLVERFLSGEEKFLLLLKNLIRLQVKAQFYQFKICEIRSGEVQETLYTSEVFE